MILACQNIEKSFDGVTILQDASFHIEEREKVALVGINGAGKSTLFRIIVGELSLTTDRLFWQKERPWDIWRKIRKWKMSLPFMTACCR